MRRLLAILLEGAGVTLFGSGILSTLLFISAEPRSKLTQRALAKIPNDCEAAFNGKCWYTIQDHPFWFALSLASIVAGAGIMAWCQRRWFPKRKTEA
jgi:hypothetical protein